MLAKGIRIEVWNENSLVDKSYFSDNKMKKYISDEKEYIAKNQLKSVIKGVKKMKIKVLNFGYEKLPFRAHENDAGADVCACFHDGSEGIWIEPNTSYKIPLGMGLVLPDGYAAYVFPRSGLSSSGIVCELPPIDSGYRGEIHAIVTNCGKTPRYINSGDRIGQLVITPIVIADFITEDIKERGDNGFGSTGL